MLHHRLTNPIDARVISDYFMHGINHHNLEPLVRGILGHPIRIENTQASTFASDTFLSDVAEVTHSLPFLDTLMAWFSVNDTLGHTLLAISSFDTNAIN